MRKRIYGLETEYGLLIKDSEFELDPVDAANRIKNHIFTSKLGILDLHYRANDEPPGNGGFLLNGGRVYLDMGHLEYASPECATLTDLITYDRAGDCIIQDAVNDLGWGDSIAIIKNNVDLETSATFGCHENYLVSRGFPFDERDNLKLFAGWLTGACKHFVILAKIHNLFETRVRIFDGKNSRCKQQICNHSEHKFFHY